ncbi:DUF1428 domain-containing protein [Microvirga yunnanensis]|uniref:DUF1428 domain-containing protein n=3 Tax=Microvirga TaxID=186650 RepID=UPI0021CA0B28|nr:MULTISPECIES: DUF1428 domain-containing protein [unclassified Microvirga]
MTYVDGFVLAVPADKKEEYRRHAAEAAPLFKEFGATRMVECWGDDVPDGKLTDFRRSVQAKDDETVVFSWIEYPSKEIRDAANHKIMTDSRMQAMGEQMPFDGKRMIFGGFDTIVDEDSSGTAGYTDGFVVPVPSEKKADYLALAQRMAGKFKEYGAVRVLEAWGDDVPNGEVTDYWRAVQAQDGEEVVYSYIQWPDKATRDAGWARMMAADPEQSTPMPFDGKRMFWGGFRPILDTAAE